MQTYDKIIKFLKTIPASRARDFLADAMIETLEEKRNERIEAALPCNDLSDVCSRIKNM